ncbi:MAG: ATP-binding protein [Oscillospiraceae bacterium]|nr:ATP-binding protein [Oscillospiraceae bacterium]
MFFGIKNTGKISNAEIELNGITVIAGFNNTGKSTVGKMLFCLFNSFYNLENQIRQERRNLIEGAIGSEYYLYPRQVDTSIETDSPAEYILNKSADYSSISDLCDDIKRLSNEENWVNVDFVSPENDGVHLRIAESIMRILNISDDEIFVTVLERRLFSEFNMQINNRLTPGLVSEVALSLKDAEISILINDEKRSIEVNNHISLNTEVLYIDNPFALDDRIGVRLGSGNHRAHLKTKLLQKREISPVKEAFGSIIVTKRLEKVLAQVDKVCKQGRLVSKSGLAGSPVAFQEGNADVLLDMKNVSTGLKTFVIIKTLLINGSLEENGILVLDEPEIHLHPEWQLIFAELIVLIQKEFNMHILLNTHSPYFLDAIDVFSRKYGIAGKCKYYLAEEHDGLATISDVSSNIEKIFEKLARPLQVLENMRYSDDSN